MASAVTSPSSSSAVQKQYPQIDKNDPAKSFFDLIRAGKFEDSETEYGALTMARESDIVAAALAKECPNPSFKMQTVAEKYIETLLEETTNPLRCLMARDIAFVMKDRSMDTLFSDIVETIALVQSEDKDADIHVQLLSRENGIQEFLQRLVVIYAGRTALFDLFDVFQSTMPHPAGSPDLDAEQSHADRASSPAVRSDGKETDYDLTNQDKRV